MKGFWAEGDTSRFANILERSGATGRGRRARRGVKGEGTRKKASALDPQEDGRVTR